MTRRGDDRPAVVDAFSAGDEAALAEIYARWSPLVYSFALGSLGSVADAEEVTQRVFTGAWASRQSFDATRARLSAWLIGIARTAIAESQTRRGQGAPLRTPTAVTQTDETTASAELADRLLVVDEVSRLDAVPQRVLRMALHDDLSHAQIAERTGLTPATVRGHIRRSLLSLRERLEVQPDAC